MRACALAPSVCAGAATDMKQRSQCQCSRRHCFDRSHGSRLLRCASSVDPSGRRVTHNLSDAIADLDFYRQLYSAEAKHATLKPPDLVRGSSAGLSWRVSPSLSGIGGGSAAGVFL
jgi:hypothetical protein